MYRYHPEHAFVIPLDSQGTASTVMTVLLQMIGLLWTTLMLLTTQQLVVRRDLGTRRTLTSTNDSNVAWSGLGCSLLTLWRQFELPAHVGGTLIAVVYLGGIAALHITTPSLFVIEAFNQSVATTVGATGSIDWLSPDAENNVAVNAQLATRMMGLLKSLPDTKGLHETVVYSVLDDNKGVGVVNVPAKNYSVDCSHRTSNAMAYPDRDFMQANLYVDGAKHSTGNISMSAAMVDYSIRFWDLYPEFGGFGKLVVSPVPIVDSTGNQAPRVTLDTPITYGHLDEEGDTVNRTMSDLSFAICTLQMANITVPVDAQTKTPYDTWSTEANGPSSVFTDSRGAEAFRDPDLDMQWWTGFAIYDEAVRNRYGLSCDKVDCTPFLFTSFEEYIMEELGLHPDVFNKRITDNPERILLGDLQDAMSRAVAAFFWSTAHPFSNGFEQALLNALRTTKDEDTTITLTPASVNVPTLREEFQVYVNSPAARLSLVLVPVIAGLLTIVILISVLVPVWRESSRQHATDTHEIDSFGLLQVIWILQRHPELQKQIGEVSKPTMSNLRKAGMVEISLVPLD